MGSNREPDDDFSYVTHPVYGTTTQAHLTVYELFGVSAEDHAALVGVWGEDDSGSGCHARVAILSEVRRCSPNGKFDRELMLERARTAGAI